jgi:hypothetical protein
LLLSCESESSSEATDVGDLLFRFSKLNRVSDGAPERGGEADLCGVEGENSGESVVTGTTK